MRLTVFKCSKSSCLTPEQKQRSTSVIKNKQSYPWFSADGAIQTTLWAALNMMDDGNVPKDTRNRSEKVKNGEKTKIADERETG